MDRAAGRSPWAGVALLLTLLWSPLAGGAALFFALHGEEARGAGKAEIAARDTRIAGLLCAVALLAGALEVAVPWLLQVAWERL